MAEDDRAVQLTCDVGAPPETGAYYVLTWYRGTDLINTQNLQTANASQMIMDTDALPYDDAQVSCKP